MKIYHNPRCRKSRETLHILKEHLDVDGFKKIEIIEYLKHPLSKKEITTIIKLLNITPEGLIRKNEMVFRELYKGKDLTEKEYVDILHLHPILMQRPIVIKDNCAVLGRPPINVLDLLNK